MITRTGQKSPSKPLWMQSMLLLALLTLMPPAHKALRVSAPAFPYYTTSEVQLQLVEAPEVSSDHAVAGASNAGLHC